jgi:hypothetical protein
MKVFHASSAVGKTFCAGVSEARRDRDPTRRREARRTRRLPRLGIELESGFMVRISFDRRSALA